MHNIPNPTFCQRIAIGAICFSSTIVLYQLNASRTSIESSAGPFPACYFPPQREENTICEAIFFPNSAKSAHYYSIIVAMAQLVVRPPGREDVVGSNPGCSRKFLWRKLSRSFAGVLFKLVRTTGVKCFSLNVS